MNRGEGDKDRAVGTCMLLGAALGIAYAPVFGNFFAVAYGVGLGSAVGLALRYYRRR